MQETWVWSQGWEDPLEEDGNLVQYFCLENPVGRETWWLHAIGMQRVGHDFVTKQQKIKEVKVHICFCESVLFALVVYF